MQSLTSYVAQRALPRELLLSQSRRICLSFVRQTRTIHGARIQNGAIRLKTTPTRNPGRLPLARCSASQPSEDVDARGFVCVLTLAPVHPTQTVSSPHARGLLRRAISRALGQPFGSLRGREKDASHQLLQPTHDTSTRRPLDSRARSLRHGDRSTRPSPSKPEERHAAAASTRLAATRPQVDRRLTPLAQLRFVRRQDPP